MPGPTGDDPIQQGRTGQGGSEQAQPEQSKTFYATYHFAEVEKPCAENGLDTSRAVKHFIRPKDAGSEKYSPPANREELESAFITQGWDPVKRLLFDQTIAVFDRNLTLSELPAAQDALEQAQVPQEQHEEVFEAATRKIRSKLQWAAEESIKNAGLHGNQCDPSKFVEHIAGFSTDGNFLLWVKDDGLGYIPADIPPQWIDEQLQIATGRGLQTALGLMGNDNWTELWTKVCPGDWPSELSPERYGTMRIFDQGAGIQFRFGWQRAILEAYSEIGAE